MGRYAIGTLAGMIATALMTIVISAGKLFGLLRTPPPTEITTNVSNRVGIDPAPPDPEFNIGTLIAHHGFGAVCGVIYVLARRYLPASSTAAGLLFGGLVWTTAYLGFLPMLKLYPWPDDDRHSRTAVMIAAHAVYGTTLSEAEKRLAGRT